MDEIKIIREGVIPLHAQLLNQLRHLILSGKWAPDTRIPSEPELGRQLNISRSTVRQALDKAQVEGLITRVPGKGTYVARAAQASRSHHIAYVTDDCCGGMQSQVLVGIESALAARGYRAIFVNTHGELQEENRLLDELVLEDRVAGILIWPVLRDQPSGRLLQLTRQNSPPVVVVDRIFEGLSCDYVTSENYAGAYAAVQHLVELGHRHITFLSRPILRLPTVAARLRGYQDALQEAGLAACEPWLVGHADQELNMSTILEDNKDPQDQDIKEIARGLTAVQRPTALFTVNDFMAIKAMQAARMLGLDVPQDLSLVGFDDIPLITSLLDVPLTTIAQDAQAMGKRATELLMERIDGYSGAAREELLPTELRVRSSTAPPAAA